MTHEPFVIGEFIAVVVRRHNIHQQNVFGFWVQPGDLHFEAGEHPPVQKTAKYDTILKLQLNISDRFSVHLLLDKTRHGPL